MPRSLTFALVVACAVSDLASAAPGQAAPQQSQQAPPVAVLELDGTSDKLAFAGVTKPSVTIALTVENRGKKALKNVSIGVSRFTSPTGEFADPKVFPETADIAPGAARQFDVLATFLSAGSYVARARVLQAGKLLVPFKIEVARTLAQPAVSIGEMAAFQATAQLGHPALDLPLSMKLYATQGPATLPPPLLHSVVRKPKADSNAGVAAEAALDVSKLPQAIEVVPGRPTQLAVKLTGIGSPGKYDVKVRFASAGFEVIEKDVTVYVRDPAWVALGLIAVGVVLSLLINAYGGIVRPRLLLQGRVAALLESLRELEQSAATDAAGKQLALDVHRAISHQWDAGRARGLALAPQIDTYELVAGAVRIWCDLHRSASAVRPQSVRRKLLTMLDDAAASLRDTPLDLTKVTTSVQTLRQFHTTIRNETDMELRQQLVALDKALATDPRSAAARLRSALLQVGRLLDAGQIEAAVGSYVAARLQYANLLADDLMARIAAETAPAGMDAADWRRLQDATAAYLQAVRSASDADEAMTHVAAAMKEYLISVVAGLRAAAAALGDEAKAKPVLDALDTVQQAVEANDLTAAWQRLDGAQALYTKAAVPVGRPMGPALEALTAAARGGVVGGGAFDIMQVIDVPPPATDLDIPGAQQRTQARLSGYDFLASVVVLFVAILVGFQVLWIDNPTWGGWAAYLAAFGWGFALDQFTHAGIKALRPK